MNKRRLIIVAFVILATALITIPFLIGGRENAHTPPAAGKSAPPASPPVASSHRLSLLSSLSGGRRTREVAARIAGLRVMNYYPAANSWTKMWTNWDANVLDHDFDRIHALGGNAVRIIVFPYTFGWPTISSAMADRFAATLKIASHHGLAVQVTLFDWWGQYDQITESKAWLRSLLRPYASDPEIQLVELKNEVDPGDAAEVAWVRALLPALRSVMRRTPSTVSVSGTAGPSGFVQLRKELGRAPLDVADMHFYGNAVTAYSWMLAAKRAAGDLPLFIGEIGVPLMDTYGAGSAAAAYQQAHWFSVVFAAARAAGLSTPAPWTLYDFKPGTAPSTTGTSRSYNYGLYSDTGHWRPAVEVVQEAFAGRSADTSNLNFNLLGQNKLPMVWSPDRSGQGQLSYDSNVKHLGSDSVRISGTGPCFLGSSSFFLVPTEPAISGQLWTVSAWAKGANVGGVAQVSLSWFDSAGSYVGNKASESLAQGDPTWTKLTVSAHVPPNATGVVVHLKSCGLTGTVWFANVQIRVSS